MADVQINFAGLVSEDNDLRNQAEAHLNEVLESNTGGLLINLAQAGTQAQDAQLRAFALLLLRRLSSKTLPPTSDPSNPTATYSHRTYHGTLSLTDLASIHSLLLNALASEPEQTVRNRLCDAIAGISQLGLDEKIPWAGLNESLVAGAGDGRAEVRESVFRIWADSPALLDGLQWEMANNIFIGSLRDQTSLLVRLAALKASCAWFLEMTTDAKQSSTPLVGEIVSLLTQLHPSHPAELAASLQHLIPIASLYPLVFQTTLPTLLPFILTVASPPVPTAEEPMVDLIIPDDSPSQPAFEFFLSLVESKPSLIRKLSAAASSTTGAIDPIDAACKAAIQLVATLEDEENWGEEDVDEDEEDGGWSVWGEEVLDRMANSLGGKSLLPVLWPMVESLLSPSVGRDWKSRYAGLITIASVAEGTAKLMEPQLRKIMELICPLINDPHPRVRYALVHCIGQLCTDFQFVIQPLFTSEILTMLHTTLSHPLPRVHGHAAAALVNFCDGVDTDDDDNSSAPELGKWLEELVKSLMRLLEGGKKFVQEQAVTSLATVAACSGKHFARFYPELMPILLNFLRNPPSTDEAEAKLDRMLRGKVLECCGLIGLAVGNDVFRPDAVTLAQILVDIQSGITDDDDPQAMYVMQTWGKICEALREEFEPFLPTVMPPLLRAASLQPDISIMDPDDEELDAEDGNKADWEVLPIDGHQVGIKTSTIEETAEAFSMLVIYASRLGNAFGPYMEETMTLSLKNLTFFFHDEVRQSASIIIPILISTAKHNGQITPALLDAVFDRLTSVLAAEADAAILAYFFKSISDNIRVIGVENFAPQHREALEKAVETILTDMADRRKLRTERSAEWDEEDREAAIELEREEGSALSELSKLLLHLDPNHRLSFVCSGVKDLGIEKDAADWSDEE